MSMSEYEKIEIIIKSFEISGEKILKTSKILENIKNILKETGKYSVGPNKNWTNEKSLEGGFRKVLQEHSKESKIFKGKEEIFYRIKNKGYSLIIFEENKKEIFFSLMNNYEKKPATSNLREKNVYDINKQIRSDVIKRYKSICLICGNKERTLERSFLKKYINKGNIFRNSSYYSNEITRRI